MINEAARLEHWSTGWTVKNQGDSPPTPFYMYMDYFDDKDVLEIGPGGGRQYNAVKHLTKSYAIADISSEALACFAFDAIDHKYLLSNYSDKLHRKFDLIHFWYVLHHIPSYEFFEFVVFLVNHLNDNGIVMFNTPYLGFDKGAYGNDGVLTTGYRLDEIFRIFDSFFFCIILDGSMYGSSNGHVYIGRKR